MWFVAPAMGEDPFVVEAGVHPGVPEDRRS
jgi:hypothetical protein